MDTEKGISVNSPGKVSLTIMSNLTNVFWFWILPKNTKTKITLSFVSSEYATVGYMAKRIQMRKSRILAMRKIAEDKKKEALDPGQPSAPNESDIVTLPKQTVSLVLSLFVFSLVITINYTRDKVVTTSLRRSSGFPEERDMQTIKTATICVRPIAATVLFLRWLGRFWHSSLSSVYSSRQLNFMAAVGAFG